MKTPLRSLLVALLLGLLASGQALGQARAKIALFVHGVSGDAEQTWKTVMDRGAVKPQVVAAGADGTVPPQRGGDFYSMDLSEPPSRLGVPISPGLITHQAGELASAVEAIRRAPGNEGRSIVLVAHSRGGMVTREYLAGARFAAERPPVSDVTFIGVPHLLHTRVRGNAALPRSVRYYTLLNPDDHVVNLSQQTALWEQQPALEHRQLKTSGWSDRIGHTIGGAPADQLWAAVDAIAQADGWADRFNPYDMRRQGLDLRAWGAHSATTLGSAGVGLLVGRSFGPIGLIVGGVAGAMVGASLASGTRWALGESLVPRGRLVDGVTAPAAPAASGGGVAEALRLWQRAVAALSSAAARGGRERLKSLLDEVKSARAALDRSAR